MVKWRSSYETGIASMDKQHKVLIDLINQLYDMIIRDDKHSAGLDTVLQRCFEYADEHLQSEERLMMEHGYPELEAHLAAHNVFKMKIAELKGGLATDPEKSVNKTYTFIRSWLLEHILGVDMKYGPFLQSKGAK